MMKLFLFLVFLLSGCAMVETDPYEIAKATAAENPTALRDDCLDLGDCNDPDLAGAQLEKEFDALPTPHVNRKIHKKLKNRKEASNVKNL
jgi:PBP1b-binding outer membrane lipoprotein LpoB